MSLRRVAAATPAFALIIAAPASASTAAAAPSPTPLILELALAAVVVTAMALRRPAERLLGAVRRVARPPLKLVAAVLARLS